MNKKKKFTVTRQYSSEEYCFIDAHTLAEAEKIAENESLDWQLEWQTDEIEVEEWKTSNK